MKIDSYWDIGYTDLTKLYPPYFNQINTPTNEYDTKISSLKEVLERLKQDLKIQNTTKNKLLT